MADFLTTHGISYQIERIILEARTELYLVSPYLQLSKLLTERLKDASNRNIAINIIYGKNALKSKERDFFKNLNAVKLYHFENLHAKCFFNEEKMVLTSMNMYEFSEKNNREMGILITKAADKTLYTNAVTETFSIIEHSVQCELSSPDKQLLQATLDTSSFEDVPDQLKFKLNGLTLAESMKVGVISSDDLLRFDERGNDKSVVLVTVYGDIN